MPVNEVFVGCLESDEYFNAAKLDELKNGNNLKFMMKLKMLVGSISQGDGFALRRLLMREEYQKQDL